MLVLVERHPCNQLLHKLSLSSLSPALKVSHTEIALVVKMFSRRHGELARVFVPVLTHHRHLYRHLLFEVLAGRTEGEVSEFGEGGGAWRVAHLRVGGGAGGGLRVVSVVWKGLQRGQGHYLEGDEEEVVRLLLD